MIKLNVRSYSTRTHGYVTVPLLVKPAEITAVYETETDGQDIVVISMKNGEKFPVQNSFAEVAAKLKEET